MHFQVNLISDAEFDIIEVYNYLLEYESESIANSILNQIEESILSLSEFPGRGHIPPELKRLSISSYKEIHCKFLRIIFEIEKNKVFVYAVLDGRRDIQSLLENRLLRQH